MNIFKIVFISGGLIAAVLAVLIFSGKLPIGSGSSGPTGEVIVWGTYPQDQTEQLLLSLSGQVKTYHVTYKFIREDAFATTLVEALASGKGPDLILAPYQTILEQTNRIYPYPAQSFSEKAYKDAYVDGASIFWTDRGTLAFPVSIEPMVLFYNRTLLSKHGVIAPPQYWDELPDLVQKLAVITPQGGFTENAIAFGSYANVMYAKDIITTIINQLGQLVVFRQNGDQGKFIYSVLANTPVKEGGDIFPLATTLRYFMEFADPTKSKYTWNQFQPLAQDQFVAEKLALYVGFLGEEKTIRERNQRVDFDIALLPQTRNYNTFVTGMRLYGVAAMQSAKNPNAALALMTALATPPWNDQLAAIIGAVPATRAYVRGANVPEIVAKSNLVAKGWYDIKPQATSGLFEKMIKDVASGRSDITEASGSFVSRLQALYTGQ